MDLHQLWTILSTPDNVPIVLLLFVVPFYTWYGLRQAFVNTSSYGCDALVVDNDDVRVIPLPALGYDEITSQVNNMLAALDMAAGGEVDAPAEALAGILGWLWTAVARPVLDALNLNERPDLTGQDAAPGHRLWWCPTGVLSLLPVHAAGLYGPEHAAVPERVISSY